MPRSDARSDAAKSYRRLYKTALWKKFRAEQLEAHPLCQCPHCQEGKRQVTIATVVDHRKPHRGNRRLFFDRRNLWSLGASCHSSAKQSEERGGRGFSRGCDVDGWPLEPMDHA